MTIRPVAFTVTAVFLILCSALHAFSQQPSDRGFLEGKKYDLKGPASLGEPKLLFTEMGKEEV